MTGILLEESAAMLETRHGMCRSCAATCPILIDVEDQRPVRIIGDKDNPVYWGYTCIKGREMVSQVSSPTRLLSSMRRCTDGSHEAIGSDQAMDEVSVRLRQILDEHGPRSIATYAGTYIFQYPVAQPVSTAWMKAIESPMVFTSNTIDQPGKAIAGALHGSWSAGPQVFDDADTWLLVGVNPLVSHSGGIPNQNPAKRLKEGVERGLKLIVIDPRRTECARKAHIHLQARAGEDPTVLAGMVRVIIEEKLHDANFVAAHTQGFDALAKAVASYTPDYVEHRAGVAAEQLVRAARTFAGARRGGATGGTGVNMAPRGNLSEYLLLCLMSICGRWLIDGEAVPNPGVLGPKFVARAQANPPSPAWGYGEALRVRGFTDAACGLPVSALADEILLPGEGQVKALIVLSGNPLMGWPDQRKTIEALKALDLLVCLDVEMAHNSCHMADYVIGCTHSLESPAMTLSNEMLSFFATGFGYSVPYAQYAPAAVSPPQGSDLIEMWEFFYGTAQRMGLELEMESSYSWASTGEVPPRYQLDMENKPSTDGLFELLCAHSNVSLDEVKKYPAGAIFQAAASQVLPQEPGWEGRLQVGDPTMMAELADIQEEIRDVDRFPGYPMRLISRRTLEVCNSTGRSNPRQLRKRPFNPAFMNSHDIEALGLREGDLVRIESRHDQIVGVVAAEDDVRPGVISMTHCFGGVHGEDESEVRKLGSHTGRLTSVEVEVDPYSGIPRMSAIPVRIEPVSG
jgi:anaerobic selenocysteine-containing dehydrogenase